MTPTLRYVFLSPGIHMERVSTHLSGVILNQLDDQKIGKSSTRKKKCQALFTCQITCQNIFTDLYAFLLKITQKKYTQNYVLYKENGI